MALPPELLEKIGRFSKVNTLGFLRTLPTMLQAAGSRMLVNHPFRILLQQYDEFLRELNEDQLSKLNGDFLRFMTAEDCLSLSEEDFAAYVQPAIDALHFD